MPTKNNIAANVGSRKSKRNKRVVNMKYLKKMEEIQNWLEKEIQRLEKLKAISKTMNDVNNIQISITTLFGLKNRLKNDKIMENDSYYY